MSKAVRIIYLWKLNCYKLTNTKKKPITLRDNPYEPEANTYFKAVYKLINEEISKRMIILPVTLDFLITAIIHYLVKDKCDNNPLVFAPIMIFVVLFTVSFPYLIFQLHKVHEFHRIKTETEFLINTIIWWIVFPLYVLCEYFPKFKNNPAIQYYTNKGIFFFVIQELFVFFIITSIPFYEMYTDKKKYKDFEEEMMSIEYFYKLINDPIIIEELKEVAISEFSIENVLFWESYRELMKLSKHQKNSAIKKILYTGLNKINKELNHKSSKSNNIINKMINNDPHQNLNQDSSNIVYENEKYVGHKYYDNLSHQNQKKKNNVREMEMYPNNYYYYNNNNEYDYYNNCSSSNSTTNNLLEYTSDSTNSYYYSYSSTSPLNKNYTYIDKYQDNYDNYNFNLYQNQNQRRRSIKQYNINIESKTDNTENFNDNSSSSSSELSADTPVPLKLYNYYQNFYHTFIDVNSTAAVNINCSVRNTIEENIKNPKIGIFDEVNIFYI
ncbi:hypothetical protein PIROE2DRAFT_13809 [Piromyces sp. E2]|nr:hypothetical protein PIROE2DRAFT_13809 [Piromyces sp. E2]|eukprot:OUM60423.1 hypothetical protein PIROE2DRAFT_13809 [Piromyces sp. E2]